MFSPKFQYTDNIVADLGKIEKYRTVLDMSIVPPYVESELKEQAKLKMSHFSTRIEGNPLNFEQVKDIIKKKDYKAKHRSEIEIRNYWDALTFLDEHKALKTPIDEKFIKKLHAIIDNDKPGRMPKESKYREPTPPGVLFAVYDSITRDPSYIPPEAKDVSILMKELVQWLAKENKLAVPIKAAILSYQFLTIHPFNDGNGRTARALATYLLSIEGYDVRGFYSIEEFYVSDLKGYYESIQMNLPVLYYDGRNAPSDLAPWIEYFVRVMVLAFKKAVTSIKNTAMELDKYLDTDDLNKKDKTLLTYMLRRPNQSFKPKEIAELFSVTPRAISKWAKDWVTKGLIEPASGEKRVTSYFLGQKYRS